MGLDKNLPTNISFVSEEVHVTQDTNSELQSCGIITSTQMTAHMTKGQDLPDENVGRQICNLCPNV